MTFDLASAYRSYHGSLVRMLWRRTGDRDRAEDLAHEAFARAAASPPVNPRPWLFAVALNLVREEGRRGAIRSRRLQLYRAEGPQAVPGPDEGVEREERVARVRRALLHLADRDREILLLKAEGFSYDEIAESLGLARGAVGTTLSRARKKLVEAYHRQEGGRDAAS